ncbi:hypothetical protein Tco_0728243 [Tanacetum coccineum]|uniref:Uncharacterized protein n=1 Tax=Tanacetum coccineum TaxID=301880 RepID=A0ABQ4YLF9_9ASTR
MVSSLIDEIDFRISFDEFDDEDYMVVFDKNSFSYKILSTNDLKTDSKNDNEKVNRPLFLSPKPTVSCFDDLDFFKDFENEFPTIVYNDALTSKSDFLTESILSPRHIDEFDLNDMALPPRDQRHQYLRCEGLQYTYDDILDFESRLTRIYRREVHKGVSLYTSRAWRQLFDIRGPLVHELILEFFSTFRFGEAVIDLDTAGALLFQLGGTVGFGAYWVDSTRQIPNKGNLRDYWIGISSAGDFLGTVPSYTTIQDPILKIVPIRETPRIDMYFPPNLPDVSIWAELGEIKQIVMRLFRAPDKGTSAEPPTTSTGGAS